MDVDVSGQSLVAVSAILGENLSIVAGVDRMQTAVEQMMECARNGNKTVAETLAGPGKLLFCGLLPVIRYCQYP